jgi:hypothetical protein
MYKDHETGVKHQDSYQFDSKLRMFSGYTNHMWRLTQPVKPTYNPTPEP